MLVKIYWSLWILFAVVVAVLFAAGSLDTLAVVVAGFVAFGLTFMGMMNVLPGVVAHPSPPAPRRSEVAETAPQQVATGKPFHVLKSA
jgi:hypothetical protein